MLQLACKVLVAVDVQNAIILEYAIEHVSHDDRRQHAKMPPLDLGVYSGFSGRRTESADRLPGF